MQPLPTPGQDTLVYTADQYDGSWLWLAALQDLGSKKLWSQWACVAVLYSIWFFSIELWLF